MSASSPAKPRRSIGRAVGRRLGGALGPPLRITADLLFHPWAGKVRRDPRRWVFGHEDGLFAGNPRMLYLSLLDDPEVEPHWITGDWRTWSRMRRLGWPASMRWSPSGMYRAITAGAAFFAHRTSDVNASLLRGALLVNLWHGVGLKAIQLGWHRGRTAKLRSRRATRLQQARYRAYLTDPDLVVTTSSFMQAHFAKQFGLPEDHCPILGYPRCDTATDPALAKRSRQFDEPRDFLLRPTGMREAYLYMPTSRDSNRPLLGEAFPDLPRLERLLAERRAIMWIKLHPRTWETVPAVFDHIRPWPSGVDIYNYLHEVDALITDYSSVHYDYLAHRLRGAVIYAFDLAAYLERDRSLLYPFEENVAGLVVLDFEALCSHIEGGLAEAPIDQRHAQAVRDKFWSDGDCPTIVEHVQSLLTQRALAGGSYGARDMRPAAIMEQV